jgi:hypothetical protein
MKNLTFIMAISVLLSGCGRIDFDSDSPLRRLIGLKTKGEFVSGSTQYQTSLFNNYKLQTSLGGHEPRLRQTTVNGYKIYASVQGSLMSEIKQ